MLQLIAPAISAIDATVRGTGQGLALSLNANGVIVIVSPSSNESIGDIVGDDASKKIGRTLTSNLTGTIMATSGEDFVNVYTVVL